MYDSEDSISYFSGPSLHDFWGRNKAPFTSQKKIYFPLFWRKIPPPQKKNKINKPKTGKFYIILVKFAYQQYKICYSTSFEYYFFKANKYFSIFFKTMQNSLAWGPLAPVPNKEMWALFLHSKSLSITSYLFPNSNVVGGIPKM